MPTYRLTFTKRGSTKDWSTLVKASCEGDAAAQLIESRRSYPDPVTKIKKVKKVNEI